MALERVNTNTTGHAHYNTIRPGAHLSDQLPPLLDMEHFSK